MLKGKTSTGFEYELEEDALDDYELLEVLVKIDNGSIHYITQALPMLLGDDQFKRLKIHLKEQYGKVKASLMMNIFSEIMNSNTKGKN